MSPTLPRPLALAPLALLLLGGREAREIVWAPQEGIELERTFTSHASYSLESLDMELDGEPVPEHETPDLSIESDERIVVTDRLAEVGAGRPLRLERTFDTLERDVTYHSDRSDEDLEERRVCELEGHAIVLRWDEDDEEWVAEPAEGEDLDEDELAPVIEDMDLRQFLPKEEVEVGDEWEVEADAYARLMWPGGPLRFHIEDEPFDESDAENDAQLLENLTGGGTVTLEELREEDGVPIAVLAVHLEISTDASRTEEGEHGTAERTISIERTIEGSLWWDLEAGHLRSAELEADATLEVREEGSFETPEGREIEVVQTRGFEGTIRYAIEVALAGG